MNEKDLLELLGQCKWQTLLADFLWIDSSKKNILTNISIFDNEDVSRVAHVEVLEQVELIEFLRVMAHLFDQLSIVKDEEWIVADFS